MGAGCGKEGSLTLQRGHRAGHHTSSHSNKAACICTRLSCVQSIVLYMTSDLPHISRRGLGSYCSHFEDEEAEQIGQDHSSQEAEPVGPRTIPQKSPFVSLGLNVLTILSSPNLKQVLQQPCCPVRLTVSLFQQASLPQVPSVARPSPMFPPSACHTSGPPSALVNLSPNPVDTFFKGASTPNMSVQNFPLLPEHCGPLLGLAVFHHAPSLPKPSFSSFESRIPSQVPSVP